MIGADTSFIYYLVSNPAMCQCEIRTLPQHDRFSIRCPLNSIWASETGYERVTFQERRPSRFLTIAQARNESAKKCIEKETKCSVESDHRYKTRLCNSGLVPPGYKQGIGRCGLIPAISSTSPPPGGRQDSTHGQQDERSSIDETSDHVDDTRRA
jgi:hypothetical protein